MPETLLTPTSVKLYGRLIEGLSINVPSKGFEPPPLGDNNFLRKQLQPDAEGNAPYLARIYGYAYEGQYQDLPAPALFLVHGVGSEMPRENGRTTMDATGVAARDWEFSEPKPGGAKADAPNFTDLRYWEYDKGDYSMRLDVQSGTFEQLLTAGPSRTSGMDLRTSGMDLRTSGMDLRTSGMDLRTSGMDLRRR